MDHSDVIKLFSLFATAYPKDKTFLTVDKEVVKTWAIMLSDIPLELAIEAVKVCATTSPFVPSISEIRANAYKLSNPIATRTADEAWAIALKTVRKYGCSRIPVLIDGRLQYPVDMAKENTPPDVWAFMERFGYADICRSDEPDVIRGQFCKLWDVMAKRNIEKSVLPPSIGQYVGRIAKRETREIDDGTTSNPD